MKTLTSKTSHGIWRVPWLTLILTSLLTLLYCLGNASFDLLLFDKHAIADGELWRLLTGHAVHCNLSHFFWDVAVFSILCAFIEQKSRKQLIVTLFITFMGVTTWLCLSPGIILYCGLSGALTGLVVIAVNEEYQRTKNKAYLIVLFLTLGKILYEYISGKMLFADISAQALPGAHVAGFITGILYCLLASILEKLNWYRERETKCIPAI